MVRHWLVAAIVAVATSCSTFDSDEEVQAPDRGDAAAGAPCVLDDPKAALDQCTLIE